MSGRKKTHLRDMAGCVGDDKKEVSFVANNLNPIELYIVCEWLTNRHFCLVLDHRGQVDDFNFCDCETTRQR